MRDRKLTLAFFAVAEYGKEQAWLRQQHQAGWKLRHTVWPCFYFFEKCKPADVIYQLDYNPEGNLHHKEYTQMFSDCGWEYITRMVGYSYFCKPVDQMDDTDERIFCDDESHMDMMRRIFRGRILPLLALFGFLILQLSTRRDQKGALNKIIYGLLAAFSVFYLAVFIQFGGKYWKLRRKMKY